MSTLKQQDQADVYLFLDSGMPWVRSAIFTPLVGDPVTTNSQGNPLTVIFEQERYDSPDDYETRFNEMQYRIETLIVDVGIPISRTPNRDGDVFTIESVDYEVTGIDSADTTWVTCACKVKV